MNDIYREYCDHGNPIYYQGCPGCKADRERDAEIRYEYYWKKKSSFFWTYLKEAFT